MTNDLKKMLPRIPLVDEPKDFWSFSKSGRKLAELHIGYENVKPADGVKVAETSEVLKTSDVFPGQMKLGIRGIYWIWC